MPEHDLPDHVTDALAIIRGYADEQPPKHSNWNWLLKAADMLETELKERRASPAPVSGATVKPLEWKDGYGVKWAAGSNPSALIRAAYGLGVHYTIHEKKLGGFILLITEAFRSFTAGNMLRCDSEDACRAAAQADYERRILAALSLPTPSDQPAYSAEDALRRARDIALQSEAAPICMSEIVKVADKALGEETPLPEWMTKPAPPAPVEATEAVPFPTQPMIFLLTENEGVLFDPQGKFHGWVMKRHPDGLWVSVRKLEAVDPEASLPPFLTAALQASKTSDQGAVE